MKSPKAWLCYIINLPLALVSDVERYEFRSRRVDPSALIIRTANTVPHKSIVEASVNKSRMFTTVTDFQLCSLISPQQVILPFVPSVLSLFIKPQAVLRF